MWVAPGDYTKAVTVDKAITLIAQGPGPSRVVGLSGSLAKVVGIAFDGDLAVGPVTLVTCESGLTIEACTFVGGIRGVKVAGGAEDVLLQDCTFNNYIEAMAVDPGVGSVRVVGTDFLSCSVGINASDTLSCPGGSRAPAARCQTGECGEIVLEDVYFEQGDDHIRAGGDVVIRIQDSHLDRASSCTIEAQGVRLEMTNTQVTSVGGGGNGLVLRSVSGFIQGSQILFWDVGIEVGDGGCPLYSDIVIGGALEDGNRIGNSTWNLLLTQPEPVNAELNYWGSTTCASVLEKISGQDVTLIANNLQTQSIDCSTAVEPATWGRIKGLYLEERTGRP